MNTIEMTSMEKAIFLYGLMKQPIEWFEKNVDFISRDLLKEIQKYNAYHRYGFLDQFGL